MINRPGLRADVLDGVDAGDGALTIVKVGQIALNPRVIGKFCRRLVACKEHQFVVGGQPRIIGSQFTVAACESELSCCFPVCLQSKDVGCAVAAKFYYPLS